MIRLQLLFALPLLVGAGVAEPDGYRMDDYAAPVPDRLAGARVVDATGLAAAIRDGAVVIDVFPAPRRPPTQPPSQPWLPPPRLEVPGSLWWPDVGRGAISARLAAWFRDRLATVTGGNLGRPVAFYCRSACWMSWNAAKRAVSLGYTNVLWFADGPEAWSAFGGTLQRGTPETVPF